MRCRSGQLNADPGLTIKEDYTHLLERRVGQVQLEVWGDALYMPSCRQFDRQIETSRSSSLLHCVPFWRVSDPPH